MSRSGCFPQPTVLASLVPASEHVKADWAGSSGAVLAQRGSGRGLCSRECNEMFDLETSDEQLESPGPL